MRTRYLLSVSALSFICFYSSLFAEDLVITTYYPSPYGSYRELRAQRMAIGDNYSGSAYCWEGTCTTTIHADADLVVEGNVGIGTATPNNLLQVNNLINFNNTDFNTFLGKDTGLNIVSGAQSNTYLGYVAGSGGVGGTNAADFNTAVGHQSLFSNTIGFYNTAQGASSLFSNTTGYQNTAQGASSLFSNTTGYQNTAQGASSLISNTAGYYNTAQGVTSLSSNTSGYRNTAQGYNSGRYIANGATANQTPNNSVYLGYDTRALANGDTNEIVIGASATGAGSNSVVLGNNSITKTILNGNVGIGTTTPAATANLHIKTTDIVNGTELRLESGGATWAPDYVSFYSGGSRYAFIGIPNSSTANLWISMEGGARLVFNNLGPASGSATLCTDTNGVVANCTSSERYKKNIKGLKLGLETVQQLKPVIFNWKETGEKDLGLIAEDVYSVDPILVTYNKDGEIEGVKYNQLTAILINAVKEQQKEIDDLKELVCKGKENSKPCRN